MSAVLVCEGLGRSFGGVVAVVDVGFEVGAGESVALIGPNGAGKSTTLAMLTTTLRPDRGRVEVLGIDAVRDPRAVRGALGVLFQEPALDERLSPAQNLSLHAALHGLPRRETQGRVAAALDGARLGPGSDRPVRGFSLGMKRRVELARALMHRPRLLVLDEPTAGLDPAGRHDLWARIEALRCEGLAVVLATHIMEEAERCGRIGIVAGGRLVAIDTPERLRDRFGCGAGEGLDAVFLRATGRALGEGERAAPAPRRRAAG